MADKDPIIEALIPSALAPLPEDEGASLFDLGVIDSFGLMDVVARLEGAFGVKVPESQLLPKTFETITKIRAYFKSPK